MALGIIAVGPQGGKIVGYQHGDLKKPIYQGSAAALKLAKDQGEKAKDAHGKMGVGEWLGALADHFGITATKSLGAENLESDSPHALALAAATLTGPTYSHIMQQPSGKWSAIGYLAGHAEDHAAGSQKPAVVHAGGTKPPGWPDSIPPPGTMIKRSVGTNTFLLTISEGPDGQPRYLVTAQAGVPLYKFGSTGAGGKLVDKLVDPHKAQTVEFMKPTQAACAMLGPKPDGTVQMKSGPDVWGWWAPPGKAAPVSTEAGTAKPPSWLAKTPAVAAVAPAAAPAPTPAPAPEPAPPAVIAPPQPAISAADWTDAYPTGAGYAHAAMVQWLDSAPVGAQVTDGTGDVYEKTAGDSEPWTVVKSGPSTAAASVGTTYASVDFAAAGVVPAAPVAPPPEPLPAAPPVPALSGWAAWAAAQPAGPSLNAIQGWLQVAPTGETVPAFGGLYTKQPDGTWQGAPGDNVTALHIAVEIKGSPSGWSGAASPAAAPPSTPPPVSTPKPSGWPDWMPPAGASHDLDIHGQQIHIEVLDHGGNPGFGLVNLSDPSDMGHVYATVEEMKAQLDVLAGGDLGADGAHEAFLDTTDILAMLGSDPGMGVVPPVEEPEPAAAAPAPIPSHPKWSELPSGIGPGFIAPKKVKASKAPENDGKNVELHIGAGPDGAPTYEVHFPEGGAVYVKGAPMAMAAGDLATFTSPTAAAKAMTNAGATGFEFWNLKPGAKSAKPKNAPAPVAPPSAPVAAPAPPSEPTVVAAADPVVLAGGPPSPAVVSPPPPVAPQHSPGIQANLASGAIKIKGPALADGGIPVTATLKKTDGKPQKKPGVMYGQWIAHPGIGSTTTWSVTHGPSLLGAGSSLYGTEAGAKAAAAALAADPTTAEWANDMSPGAPMSGVNIGPLQAKAAAIQAMKFDGTLLTQAPAVAPPPAPPPAVAPPAPAAPAAPQASGWDAWKAAHPGYASGKAALTTWLLAAPEGSVVSDKDGDIWTKMPGDYWSIKGGGSGSSSAFVADYVPSPVDSAPPPVFVAPVQPPAAPSNEHAEWWAKKPPAAGSYWDAHGTATWLHGAPAGAQIQVGSTVYTKPKPGVAWQSDKGGNSKSLPLAKKMLKVGAKVAFIAPPDPAVAAWAGIAPPAGTATHDVSVWLTTAPPGAKVTTSAGSVYENQAGGLWSKVKGAKGAKSEGNNTLAYHDPKPAMGGASQPVAAPKPSAPVAPLVPYVPPVPKKSGWDEWHDAHPGESANSGEKTGWTFGAPPGTAIPQADGSMVWKAAEGGGFVDAQGNDVADASVNADASADAVKAAAGLGPDGKKHPPGTKFVWAQTKKTSGAELYNDILTAFPGATLGPNPGPPAHPFPPGVYSITFPLSLLPPGISGDKAATKAHIEGIVAPLLVKYGYKPYGKSLVGHVGGQNAYANASGDAEVVIAVETTIQAIAPASAGSNAELLHDEALFAEGTPWSGHGIDFDSGLVRDQYLSVTKKQGGAREVRFKMTNWGGDKLNAAVQGHPNGKWNIGGGGYDSDTGEIAPIGEVHQQVNTKKLTGQGWVAHCAVGSQAYGIQDCVKIEVAPGVPVAKALAEFAAAVGMPELAHPPSEEAREHYKLRKMLWNVAPGAHNALFGQNGGKVSPPPDNAKLRGELVTAGLTDAVIDASEVITTGPGHRSVRIPDGDQFVQKGIHGLYHNWFSSDAKDMARKLAAGGNVATSQRWKSGMGGTGWSSPSDMKTGGADYVFHYAFRADADNYFGGLSSDKGIHIVTGTDTLERSDWHSATHDNYGCAGGTGSSGSASVFYGRANRDTALNGHSSGNGEVMIQHSVSLDEIKAVVCDTVKKRNDAISEFKALGVHTIGGRPVEQVVVTTHAAAGALVKSSWQATQQSRAA